MFQITIVPERTLHQYCRLSVVYKCLPQNLITLYYVVSRLFFTMAAIYTINYIVQIGISNKALTSQCVNNRIGMVHRWLMCLQLGSNRTSDNRATREKKMSIRHMVIYFQGISFVSLPASKLLQFI